MINVGDFPIGATVRIPWNTNAATGASITRGTNGTVRIYKNASTTQRSSASGVTDTEDFDSGDAGVGMHLLSIDTSDNADAGFFDAGNDYFVAVTGQSVDGVSPINVWVGMFSLENRSTKALTSTEYAEPGQGNPPATIGIIAAIRYLWKFTRNKKDNDGTTIQFYADNGTTVDQKQSVSVSGSPPTVEKGEIVSGP